MFTDVLAPHTKLFYHKPSRLTRSFNIEFVSEFLRVVDTSKFKKTSRILKKTKTRYLLVSVLTISFFLCYNKVRLIKQVVFVLIGLV